MAHVVESQSLYYTGGTSNKEYHLYLLQMADGQYNVHAEYGPRHRVRQDKDYGAYGSVSSAQHRYRLILDGKLKKGYQHDAHPRPPGRVPRGEALRPAAAAKPAPAPTAAGPDLAALTPTAQTLLAVVKAYDEGNDAVAEAQQALVAALAVGGLTVATSAPVQLLLVLLGHYALGAQDYVEDALAWCQTAKAVELLDGIEPELQLLLRDKVPALGECLAASIALAGLPKRAKTSRSVKATLT